MNADTGELSSELLDAAVELMGHAGRGGVVRVRGTSMLPTLVEGQTVAVEFGSEKIRPGDLLLYRQADYLVIHRLLGPTTDPTGRPCLRTRGDGWSRLDPRLDRDNVVGRVTAVHRAGCWRTLRSRPARVYSRLLVWHDLAWAAAGYLGQRVDGGLDRLGLPSPLRRITTGLDRGMLRLVHFLLFDRVHTEIPPPAEAGIGTESRSG